MMTEVPGNKKGSQRNGKQQRCKNCYSRQAIFTLYPDNFTASFGKDLFFFVKPLYRKKTKNFIFKVLTPEDDQFFKKVMEEKYSE